MFSEITIRHVTSESLAERGYQYPHQEDGWYCIFGQTQNGKDKLLTAPAPSLDDLIGGINIIGEINTLKFLKKKDPLIELRDEINRLDSELKEIDVQLRENQHLKNKNDTLLIKLNIANTANSLLSALAALALAYTAFIELQLKKSNFEINATAKVILSCSVLNVERLYEGHQNSPVYYDGLHPGYIWTLKLSLKNNSRESTYFFYMEQILYNNINKTPVLKKSRALSIIVPAKETIELYTLFWLTGPKPEHRVGRGRYIFRGILGKSEIITRQTPWIRLRRYLF